MQSICGIISLLDTVKVIETVECTYVCVRHLCAPEKWIQEKKKKLNTSHCSAY